MSCWAFKMDFIWVFPLVFLYLGFSFGSSNNVSSRPAVVNIGALFSFDSTIGRVAKIAIEEAVKDVNSNFSILHGTKLLVKMHNSNCSGFLGMVEAFQIMGTDVIAIIGPQSSVVAHIISHVADEFQVPLLTFAATDPTLSPREFPYLIRTTHSDLYQMNAVAEIVDHYGWREVIVIFEDNNYGRNGISALDDQLADRRCRISNKLAIPQGHGANQSHITDLLVQVALLETRVIVLHVNHDSGFMILAKAKYLKMMSDGFVWIATDWLSSVLDSAFPLPSKTMDTLQGVLALRLHTPDSDRKKAFFSKWNKLTGGSLGLHSYGLHAYDSVWLVAHAIDAFFNQGGIVSFSNDSKITATEQSGSLYLDSMNIFDDGPLLLKTILQSNLVGLSGPIKFDSERALALPAYDIINVVGTGFRQIGYWSNYSGLSTVTPEKLYSMPPNRSSANQQLYSVIWPGDTLSKPRGWAFTNNGKRLRIGVPIRVSYREFVSQVQGTDSFKGFCIDVFNAAVNLLPYAVPYKFIPFGDGHKNPSYTELVNSIVTGVFDAAIGDISIVTDRTKIVDFSQPYAGSGLVVVVPVKKLNFGVWAFLRPFNARMWIVIAASSLVIGIVMWILEHRVNDKFRGPPKKQLITVLWFSLATLFLAHRQNPVSTLGRAVLPIWLFVVMIIHSSYTASLTSFLTVQQLSSPINGIESLRNSDQPIGYPVGSFAEHYLSKDLGISKSRLIPLGSPLAYAQALELGPEKGGVAAVVDERPYVELFVSTHCKFRVVGQEFSKNGWGFAFPHDSPLAIDMSTAILQLSENGDLERIHDKWLMRSTCSSESSDSEIESDQLQLKSFWVLFLICGIACIIALLVHFLQIVEKVRHAEPPQCATTSPGDPQSGRLQRFLSLIDKKADQSNSGSERRKVTRSLSGNDKDGKKKQTELTEKFGPPESDYGLPNQEDLENYAFDEPSFRTKRGREDSHLEASTSNPSPKP